jgi:excisionase family DNA binding protein
MARLSAEKAMNFPEPRPIAVGIVQAANIAGVGRSFLYEEIRQGRLRIRKAGRRTLVVLSDLDQWISALPTSNGEDRAA